MITKFTLIALAQIKNGQKVVETVLELSFPYLCTGYLNKDISFGDIVYFEPKNIQYKKLVNGVINRLKVSLINGDGNEISSNFKISIVLHIG